MSRTGIRGGSEDARSDAADEGGSGPPRGSGAAAALPRVLLPSVPGGEPAPLRGARGPRVLFFRHPGHCGGCDRYARALLERAGEIGEWGATLAVVLPEAPAEPRTPSPGTGAPLESLLDAGGAVAARLGLGGAAVVIADEWGEIYSVTDAGAAHDLPSAHDVAEWVRYIAIQCPECEQPEGAWRALE